MKVFFSLILFSLVLAACHACYIVPFELMAKKAENMPPSTCVDVFDGTFHLIGSTWIAEDCYKCECNNNGLDCCHRYGGIGLIQGCKTVINPVTCEQEHYRIDDPSQRCGV
ncbi:small serum protein 5-like isoform X2 [Thamnophis elegans]|uniref:small serum protein 5-like isoform X2 n=1 Tax=Thamnophis elegans TaxID=35005 RepID=UPI001376AD1E|nr:small serum protein 5-like isoform X2 [Thamnophis elegans]